MDVLDDNLVVESAVVKGFEDGYGSIIFGWLCGYYVCLNLFLRILLWLLVGWKCCEKGVLSMLGRRGF
jgi:hypothetical protein